MCHPCRLPSKRTPNFLCIPNLVPRDSITSFLSSYNVLSERAPSKYAFEKRQNTVRWYTLFSCPSDLFGKTNTCLLHSETHSTFRALFALGFFSGRNEMVFDHQVSIRSVFQNVVSKTSLLAVFEATCLVAISEFCQAHHPPTGKVHKIESH